MANNIWVKRIKNIIEQPSFFVAKNHCDCCWTTQGGGRWVGVTEAMRKIHPKWSWVCTGCYERPPSIGLGITFAEKIERNLPPGHILGPAKDGVRGIYDVRNSRRR